MDVWFPHETCKTVTSSEEFIKNVYSKNDPIILKNSTLTRPAQRWSANFLRAKFDKTSTYSVICSKNKRFLYSKDSSKEHKMSMTEFLDKTKENLNKPTEDREYLYFQNELDERNRDADILKDFFSFDWDFLKRISKHWKELAKSQMFINGAKGSVTPCHFDEQMNIFSQIRGRKRFYLFPCSQVSI